jgi:SAM-dependent methyltransferase
MHPAPPAACRVLELGAGDGGNLIPMALTLPGSTFVGIDLAAEPVARGRRLAEDLGTTNLTLLQGDVLDLPADLGTFDYVIAHGLYSWIPPAPRDALLRACGERLAPQGVAFVSYNAYPGSYLRDMARDIMQFHVEGLADPQERLAAARNLMQLVVQANAGTPYAVVLREHFERVLQHPDALFFHDDLAEVNTPVYFHEFVAHAARHGLQFLAEARLRDSQLLELPDNVSAALDGLPDDVVVREQYIDFIVNRMFRQTLLCRADVALQRGLHPRALAGTWFAGALVAEASDGDELPSFRGPRGVGAQPGDARFAAALQALASAWPAAVAFDEMIAGLTDEDGVVLAQQMLEAHAAGVIDLHRHPPTPSPTAGRRPCASALARRQAAEGLAVVTSLRHASVRLEDPLAVHLLMLLDGTRDRARLAAEVRAFVDAGGLEGTGVDAPPEDALPAALDAALDRLARLSLLTA